MSPLSLVAAEEGFAVIVKPAGMLSEDAPGEFGVPGKLPELLEENGVPFDSVRCVHRLDRNTEGLMVYATTKEGAAALSRAVSDGSMRKIYRAYLTPGSGLLPEGEMRDRLFFDRRADKSFVVSPGRTSGKEAVLFYRLTGTVGLTDRCGVPLTADVAEIRLLTGRTHQIRVQFGSRGAPLVGDGKYGSRIRYDKPSLFCTELTVFGRTYRLPE